MALLAGLPADAVLPRTDTVERYGGKIWHGQALLAGGTRLEWDWSPLRSLAGLGFAADWQAHGHGTDLVGRALLRPSAIALEDVAGRGDGALIAALAPGLPFDCAIAYRVNLPRVAIGGAAPLWSGEVRSDAGSCRARAGGASAPVMPLVMTAGRFGGNARLTIAPQTQPRNRFVEATAAADGSLDLTVTPAGARALPFAAPNGGFAMTIAP